mmetsp:Transcript_19976/g.39235  ORF Transcript_19976/g.39235 Transcript_19976/m.39235 type:complete len:300 (+) Transcript_19976:160-1059(+)
MDSFSQEATKVFLYREDGSKVEYNLQAFTFEMRVNGVAIVRFATPKTLHALTAVSRQEMFILLEHCRRDVNVKVVVWTAQGERAFSSGASLGGSDKPDIPEDIFMEYGRRGLTPNLKTDNAFTRESRAFWDFPKPIIGAINGIAVGGGANIALCYFDMVVCSTNAKFKWPFVDIGFTPELSSSLVLPFVVGPVRAKELIYTTDWLTAEKAESWGLINDVVSPVQLLPRTLEIADKLASKPANQLSISKKVLNYQLRQKLDEHLLMENEQIQLSINEFGGKDLFKSLRNKKKPKAINSRL